jgi:hypothetical protein
LANSEAAAKMPEKKEKSNKKSVNHKNMKWFNLNTSPSFFRCRNNLL